MEKQNMLIRHWMDQMYVSLLGDTCNGSYQYDATMMDEALDEIVTEGNKEKKDSISKKDIKNG